MPLTVVVQIRDVLIGITTSLAFLAMSRFSELIRSVQVHSVPQPVMLFVCIGIMYRSILREPVKGLDPNLFCAGFLSGYALWAGIQKSWPTALSCIVLFICNIVILHIRSARRQG